MNILHITEDYSVNSGGLRTVVKDLDFYLNGVKGISSFVMSSKKEQEDSIILVNSANKNPWLYSKEWYRQIDFVVESKNISLFHIHGVWMYPQYIAAKYALKNNIPYILTPHGMFEPWLWTKGRLKKKIYFEILTKSLFSRANVIHAITEEEQSNLKQLFPQSKVVEIPNLITFKRPYVQDNNSTERYILFLGRLHEKKGIDLLIRSYSELGLNNVTLKIAGSYNEYKDVLDKLVAELDLQEKVQFLGMVKGEYKEKLFRDAFVFVAPSYSEVVGMVNLEAALQKTPVITTYQTGLKREWSENGGILINPVQKELTQALKKAMKWTKEERDDKGKNLYNFVEQNYSWEYKLKDWINNYLSISIRQ